MASINAPFPTKIAEDCVRRALIQMGLKEWVLRHWIISVEENPFDYCLSGMARWRSWRIACDVEYSKLEEPTSKLMPLARHLYSQLAVFNQAEDEEHMEALALLARRPPNHDVHRE